jgi:exonuclease III
MAYRLGLTDLYRIKYPVKKEFTYVPNARMNINRSRIDFFLIKNDQIDTISDCGISPSLSSISFDHKKIFLKLGHTYGKKDYNKLDMTKK